MPSTGEKQPTTVPSALYRATLKSIATVVLLFALVGNSWGQVSAYTFSETNGTYTAITGGNQLVTTTGGGTTFDTDGSFFTLPVASQFVFNGAIISSVNMTADGAAWLNPTTSTTGNGSTGAISNTSVASGVVCALNMDLRSTALSGQIYERRWQDLGTEIVFQWQNAARFGQSTVERFSFQIRINKSTGVVSIVYGNMTNIASSTFYQPVVGLRGSLNTDFNNRRLTTSIPDATPNWGAPNGTAAGTTNTHNCRFTSTASCFPTSGLTFVWTPAAAPTISSFTPTSGCPGATITINGTNLSQIGTNASRVLIGGTPVASITSNNGTQIVAVSGGGATGTIQLIGTGSLVTSSSTFTFSSPPIPGSPSTSNNTSTSFTANWTASAGATDYLLDVSTASNFATFVTGFNGLNVGNVLSHPVSGLTAGTTYFWRVRAVSGCASANTATQTVSTREGDNCGMIQDLALLTSPFSSTTVGYLNDFTTSNGSCLTGTGGDRIFKIDIPNGGQLFIGQSTNGYDSRHRIAYGGACPGTTEINTGYVGNFPTQTTTGTAAGCLDDDDLTHYYFNNTTGSTQTVYWVQDGHLTGEGTFTLEWLYIAPPVACSGPTSPGDAFTWSPALVSGFNADVIANGVGNANASATRFDLDNDGFALLSADYRATTASVAPSFSLPVSGIVNSAANAGVRYQLASSNLNNSLRLVTASPSGTLTLTNGTTARRIGLLVSSGSGTSTLSAQVNFSDGTNQSFTGVAVSDWYGSGYAIAGIGRVKLNGTNANVPEGTATQPGLYDVFLTLSASNHTKTISSISITKTDGAATALNVMGVSLFSSSAAPASVVCNGQTRVLSLPDVPNGVTGLTYLWQSSPTGAAPWTSTGVTTTTFTTPALTTPGTMYYRCRVQCSGTDNAFSSVIGFTVNGTASVSADILCSGGTATATALPATNSTYFWSNALGTNQTATVSAAGTYTVNVNNNGCISANNVTVTVTPNNTVALSSAVGTDNQTVCLNGAMTDITYTTTGATGIGTATGLPTGVSASWNANTITISGSPTQSGTFNYSIPLSGGGCGSISATGTITITPLPVCVSSYDPADGATDQNANGINITWSAVSGATSYDVFLGTDAAATNMVNGVNQAGTSYSTGVLSASTTYYWKVVPRNCSGEAIGCSIYSFATGSSCTAPTFTATPTSIACFGGTGSISVTASGGISPYQYSVDNGVSYQVASNFSGLSAGTYIVTIKGDDGCQGSTSTVVVAGPSAALAVTASGGGSGCEGSTLSLTSSVTGGTPGYSYVWTNAGGLSSGTVANPTATIGSFTSHAVTVTDANGCTATSNTVSITNNTPVTPTATDPAAICETETANIVATSAGNGINWYSVSSGGTPINSSPVASGANFSVSPATTTTYYAESVVYTSGSQTFNYTGNIVNWTVPAGVTSINVDARGAQGGIQVESNAFAPGNGARIVGTVSVTPGDVLKILVGGQPANAVSDEGAGGGGGSFVSTSSNVPLVVAGGGGGEGADGSGANASLTQNGTTANAGTGGTGGNGGSRGAVAISSGSGGAGFNGNGTGACTNGQGISFVNGGNGGISCGGSGSAGGFGGGGGGSSEGGGGGGGYSGGGGSENTGTDGGGGGGSYCVVTPSLSAATQTGNGQIIISYTIVECASVSRTPVTVTVNPIPATPTSSAGSAAATYSFTANWSAVSGATAYLLDVSTNNTFTSIVSGYNGLNVGNVTTYNVTGLSSATTYFYRVRSTNGTCNSLNSSTQTIATTALSSVASGNWNDGSTWSGGIVPTCADNITISSTHTVTVNTASNVSRNVTINSGGTLVVASGDLTIGCTLNNTPLANNGTLTVTGGTLNVNGNLSCGASSVFNQSGGNINIDGNNGGSATGSVASGTPLLNLLQLNSGINWTGGTLTIVDPHTATTNTNGYALFYSNSTAGTNYPSVNHTIQFGNGISTDAGGNTSGFFINHWELTASLPFGSCVINGPSGTNRSVFYAYSPQVINGNLTVNSGGNINVGSFFTIGQNLTVNSGGTFINAGTTQLAIATSNTGTAFTYAPSTSSQTIGGSGNFQNLATSPTANIASLIVNNSNATGVTISTPLSISGTLTMTAGKINTTATNLLTLGTTTAAGTLSYAAGLIEGPFRRTFPVSATATGVYDATTLFPVGVGTTYLPLHLDPVNAGGVVQLTGQAFNTNTGTAGNGVANPLSSDRWEALVSTGSGNLTNCFVGMYDADIASGRIIVQSSSATGTYNTITPTSTFVAAAGTLPNGLRTTTSILSADYTGYFTHALEGPRITSFSPTSICENTASTITITGTNLSNATAVTLNGEACTIVSNTATQIVITTDATPQAGNIVVTTAANSATSPSSVTLFTLPTVTASSDDLDNTICSGTSVVLNGGGATSYTWNNSVTNNVAFTPTTTTTYTVTGTDVNGCTNTASIAITVNDAVVITTQPANQVLLPNDNAVFSVVATGTGLAYQWQESTDNGLTWTNVSNGGIYSGATSASLTLSGVTTQNGYQYQVLISGTAPCAGVTSSVATLSISSTAISAHPQNQSICSSDGTASFTISTSGSAPTDYQWQVSTNGGGTWTNITGADQSTLSLTGLLVSNNGELYRCVLNSASITSNNALLTVSAPSVAGTASADQAICENNAPANITLTGNTGTIQWQVSSDNTSFSDIATATTSTLTSVLMGNLSSTRYYRAVVTNVVCASATSNVVTVTVTPTPSAGTLSGTQNVCANGTTTFTSNGNSGGAWSSSNTAIATVDASTGVVSGVSAGTATITYTIIGTGGCSNATATRAVTVNANPSISTATASPSEICSGGAVNLTAVSIAGGGSGITNLPTGSGNGGVSGTFLRVGSTVGNQFKTQYLFTAAELQAAGMTAGDITGLSFDVIGAGGGTVSNLTFRLGTTALTNLTTTYVTGLTQVYSIATYPATGTLLTGLQSVTFNTPFYWDGTSNLVLEGCSQLATTGTSGNLRTVATSFVSTIGNVASTTGCSSLTGGATASNRPNIQFNGSNLTSSLNWAWNTTPAVTTATGSTVASNSGSSSVSQTYTVTATNPTTGCSSSSVTAPITINPIPAAPTANNSVQCGVGIPTGTIVSNTSATIPNLNWYTNAGATTFAPITYTGGLINYYSNNFSSNTGSGALSGSASLTGGEVRLTPDAGSQLGALMIPASGITADKYNVSFNLITSNNTGADGLSYSFGDDVSATSTTPQTEHGNGSKLSVAFDAFGTNAGAAGIRIIYGPAITDPGTTVGVNNILAYSSSVPWLNANVPVVVDINNQGQLTLTVDGTAVFTGVQLPPAYLNADKSTWRHCFKARTGGLSMAQSIDNLTIQQSAGSTSYPNDVSTTSTFYVNESANGCASTATPITFTVNTPPVLTLSASTAAVCSGSSSSLISLTSTEADFSTYTWSPSATVTGTSTAGWNFAPTVATTYTLTGTNASTGCTNTASVAVTVNALPSAVTVTPATSNICIGNIQNLVATGGNFVNQTVVSENFNSGVGTFSVTSSSSTANQNWAAQANGYVYSGTTFSGSTNGFMMANSDIGGSSAATTNTILVSPAFSTVGYSSLSLSLKEFLNNPTTTRAAIEISNDNFASDITVLRNNISTDIGSATVFNSTSLTIPAAYENLASVRVRFRYVGSWDWYWAVDEFLVTGTQLNAITWTPTSSLYSNAAASTSYNGANTTSVFAKPDVTIIYTATATSPAGCTTSNTAQVTVNYPTVTSTLGLNDHIWNGASSSDFATVANWLRYNGTSIVPATSAPTTSTNVIIPANQTCVLNPASLGTNSVSANNLTLESSGVLSLNSGTLSVTGDLTTNGTFNAGTGTVTLSGTSTQSIGGANVPQFYNLTVNKSTGNVVLTSNTSVSNNLTLTSGLIELGANNLSMGTAALSGGSSTSYVKTASTGVLSRNVGNAATTFPIGNGTYNRAILTNSGTADNFTLRVIDNVTADGTGVGTPTSEPVVNRTWMVNETTAGGSDVTLRLYWNGLSEETNSFVQPSAFIAHYLSSAGSWDNIGKTNEGADFVETNNITSFSPFAISSSGTFAPLPIELVSFQANCKEDNSVAVTWTTASEHNTSHYVVEKSRDGINWSVLGQTAAAGNSTQLLNYEMIDSEKASGTTYYRLTQFDNDGVFEVFDPVSVNCSGVTSNNHITTYPNPSLDGFYVSLFTETMEGNGQLTITDASGRPVYGKSVNIQDGNNVFHIGDLNAAPGMYYIQVSNGTTTTHIVKHSLR